MSGVEFGSLEARVRDFDATKGPKLTDARVLMRDLLTEVKRLESELAERCMTITEIRGDGTRRIVRDCRPPPSIQIGDDGALRPVELVAEPAISLRDHFAGLAMQTILNSDVAGYTLGSCAARLGIPVAEYNGAKHWPIIVAMDAYVQADLMIAERAKAGA